MATGQKRLRDPSDRIARRLVGEGRVSREYYEAAARIRTARGLRIEEALIEAGMSERELLGMLAEMYKVQFISAAKLSAASIEKRTLALVPAQIAEQRQVVPVLLDRQRSVLTVVTTDPDDIETMKELEIATQVRNIRALIARPLAVEAAVRKFYLGDDFAFSLLRDENYDVARALERDPLASIQSPQGETTLTERGLELPSSMSVGSMLAVQMPSMPSMPAPASMSQPPAISSRAPLPASHGSQSSSGPPPRSTNPHLRRAALTPPPPPLVPMDVDDGSLPLTLSPRHARSEPPPPELVLDAEEAILELPPDDPEPTPPPPVAPAPSAPPLKSSPAAAPLKSSPASAPVERTPPPEKSSPEKSAPQNKPPPSPRTEAIGDPFQLALVLVSLLEGNRKDLRGHSLQTARLVRTVCERFNVPQVRTRAAEVAALVHDLGKASSYHLTPYNVARFSGHHAAAQKLHATPARVLESAGLAKAAVAAVTHMYERYDGTGFPGGLKGNEIPLESRILAICDSYTDLTSNPRNSFRKVLSAQEACEALREVMGAVFDPKVVDRFSRAVLGDDIAQRLRGDRGTILLVDTDVEETTVLELALIEKRYDVHVARAIEEACHFVEGGGIDVVVAEMVLGAEDGFELMKKVRGTTGGENVPFVFLSSETDGARVAEALDEGATDYLFKPLATQVVVAKLKRIVEQQSQNTRGSRGVSGSLEEMAIPDIVQILHQGRKTGALHLVSEGEQGTIFFKDGTIVDAAWRGLRGEDAFYAVVAISKGGFTIDPTVVPPEKVIKASPEMLLLEGMRRMDEANR